MKHDGFRIIVRKEGDSVRLWSRNGREWTAEFVSIVAELRGLPGGFVLDGPKQRGYAAQPTRSSMAWRCR